MAEHLLPSRIFQIFHKKVFSHKNIFLHKYFSQWPSTYYQAEIRLDIS